jgi:hypothetical protein
MHKHTPDGVFSVLLMRHTDHALFVSITCPCKSIVIFSVFASGELAACHHYQFFILLCMCIPHQQLLHHESLLPLSHLAGIQRA